MTPAEDYAVGRPGDEAQDAADIRPLLDGFAVGSGPDRLFRDSLKALRDTAPDEETAALYDDILAGRRSPRDLMENDAFRDAATVGIRHVREQRAQLSPEELERANADALSFWNRPQDS